MNQFGQHRMQRINIQEAEQHREDTGEPFRLDKLDQEQVGDIIKSQ